MKCFKKVMFLFVAALLLLPVFNAFTLKSATISVSAAMPEQFTYTDSGLDYIESRDQIINPDQGFYSAQSFNLPRTTATNPSLSLDPKTRGVYVVNVGLNSFSSRGGANRQSSQPADRADTEITQDALTTLENALKSFRNQGASGIFRFSYDYNAQDNPNFSGFASAEPQPASYGGATGMEAGMRLMEKHIEQVSVVLNKYLDVIVSIQGGMFGPWGEQHSTDYGDSIPQNAHWYYRLNEAWLRNLHPSRDIGVRKPIYFAWWAAEKYNNPKITFANMKDIDYSALPDGGEDARRMGGWNDGYLGSPDDWGTYMSRAEEVAWLGKQTHNSFGGEAIVDSFGNPSIYSHPSRSIAEMFTTSTSYLNSSWNTAVHNYWRGINYDKNDPEYGHLYDDPVYNGTNGSAVTSYVYIDRHLGYRYVLKQSRISNGAIQGGVLKLNGKIENVGFGNSVNKRTIEIILKQGSNLYQTEVSLDIQNVLSTKMFDYSVSLSLPKNMPTGDYEIFMKVRGADETPEILLSNPAFRTVRFANNGNIWNETLGANKIGNVSVGAGSGTHTEFEEIAFEDFSEIIRTEAETSGWNDNGATVLTSNGEGVADAVWTNTATISTTVSNYKNKFLLNTNEEEQDKWYPCFAASFVLKEPATLAVSLGSTVLVAAKEYPAGTNVINITDISELQAFKDTVAGKGAESSFTVSLTLNGGTANRMYVKWVSFYDVLVKYVPRFTIKFNANGGTLVSGSENQRIVFGSSAVAPVYEKDGFEFDGWSLSLENITHDKIIFAIWKRAGETDHPDAVLVESVVLDKDALSLNIGDNANLLATVGPNDADDRTLVWSTSNENIAMVDQNGKVFATGEGTAVISAITKDGSEITASCTVTVKKQNPIVTVVGNETKSGCDSNNAATISIYGILMAAVLVGIKIKK